MSKKFLIVDDAYFMRNLLKKELKKAGHEVVGEAKNGKEGIKLYFELKPDIVTMDINMPDISGIEATKQILSKDSKAKIIAVTGNNDDDIKRQILEAGAKEYLQKPFQPAFLCSRIDKILEEPDEVVDEMVEQDVVKPNSVVTDEVVEDDFDNMEIEIMDKPDESKSMTFVIKNEEDSFEFPEEYQKEIEEGKEEFKLSKENLEREENPQIEIEDNEPLIEFDNEDNDASIYPSMVTEPATMIDNAPSSSLIREPIKPKAPHAYREEGANSQTKIKTPKASNDVVGKSKKIDRKTEEINIRPQKSGRVTTKSSGSEVNIRPPRGKVLRGDYSSLEENEIEEPILNVSDEDNYNNDKNDGLFGIVKKLFKK